MFTAYSIAYFILYCKVLTVVLEHPVYFFTMQDVSEISALILTGNRTHQKEQLFSLPFWRKTLRNGLKN
jgi:hypothetical protein